MPEGIPPRPMIQSRREHAEGRPESIVAGDGGDGAGSVAVVPAVERRGEVVAHGRIGQFERNVLLDAGSTFAADAGLHCAAEPSVVWPVRRLNVQGVLKDGVQIVVSGRRISSARCDDTRSSVAASMRRSSSLVQVVNVLGFVTEPR